MSSLQIALTLGDQNEMDHADEADVAVLVEQALQVLTNAMRTEVVAVAWSSGKDSTACLILALMAWLRARELGYDPAPMIVLHGDTLVESPPVRALADDMIATLEEWCRAENITLIPIVYSPPLNQSYVVKVLSGTALPTFPESRRRICSAAWKVEPAGRALDRTALEAIRKHSTANPGRWPQIHDAIKTSPAGRSSWVRQPVVVIGSRMDESARRAASMAKHGQRSDTITSADASRRRTLAPIAHWTETDVWEVIGLAGTAETTYPVWQSDFSELITLYRGAAGGCVIVPGKGASSKACGARFGCHACQAVQQDESAKALVDEPRWAYTAPLLHIRDFIAAVRHDLSRRSWLDCTEDPAGFIKVYPGPLAGQTIRDLARYYMTADRLEAERAQKFRRCIEAGVEPNDPYVRACRAEGRNPDQAYMDRMQRPQFQMFDPRNTIACDIYATLRGHQARPFGILQAWHEVWHEGRSFFPPAVAPTPAAAMPEPQWIPIPDDLRHSWGHDILAVAMSETCGFQYQEDADGWPMMPQAAWDEFEVDEEAAWFIVEDEYPSMLGRHHKDPYQGPFANVMYYLNIGCLKFTGQGRAKLIARLKRMERWWEMGLIECSHRDLLAKAISQDEYIARGGRLTDGRPQQKLFDFETSRCG